MKKFSFEWFVWAQNENENFKENEQPQSFMNVISNDI